MRRRTPSTVRLQTKENFRRLFNQDFRFDRPDWHTYTPDTFLSDQIALSGARTWPTLAIFARVGPLVPGKLSGALVFRSTRMPVAAVFENLEDSLTIDEIVKMFDGLTQEQVKAVLDFAVQSLAAPPGSVSARSV